MFAESSCPPPAVSNTWRAVDSEPGEFGSEQGGETPPLKGPIKKRGGKRRGKSCHSRRLIQRLLTALAALLQTGFDLFMKYKKIIKNRRPTHSQPKQGTITQSILLQQDVKLQPYQKLITSRTLLCGWMSNGSSLMLLKITGGGETGR